MIAYENLADRQCLENGHLSSRDMKLRKHQGQILVEMRYPRFDHVTRLILALEAEQCETKQEGFRTSSNYEILKIVPFKHIMTKQITNLSSKNRDSNLNSHSPFFDIEPLKSNGPIVLQYSTLNLAISA